MRIPGVPLVPAPAGLVRFLWSQIQGRGFRPAAGAVVGGRPPLSVSAGSPLARWSSPASCAACRLRCTSPTACRAGPSGCSAAFARRVYLPPGVMLPGVGVAARRFAALPVRREIVRLPRAEACARLGLDPGRPPWWCSAAARGRPRSTPGPAVSCRSWPPPGYRCAVSSVPARPSPRPSPAGCTGAAVPAVFLPFCDDMAALLSAADLAVSRAGAGTLAELARCETPAILVPYPHAADHHQAANARYFAQQGGALVLDQAQLDELGGLVRGLLADPARLARFRAGLRQWTGPAPSIFSSATSVVPHPRPTARCRVRLPRMRREPPPPVVWPRGGRPPLRGGGRDGSRAARRLSCAAGFAGERRGRRDDEAMRAQLVRAGVPSSRRGRCRGRADWSRFRRPSPRGIRPSPPPAIRGLPVVRRGELLAGDPGPKPRRRLRLPWQDHHHGHAHRRAARGRFSRRLGAREAFRRR